MGVRFTGAVFDAFFVLVSRVLDELGLRVIDCMMTEGVWSRGIHLVHDCHGLARMSSREEMSIECD